jgi:hypothetical protein
MVWNQKMLITCFLFPSFGALLMRIWEAYKKIEEQWDFVFQINSAAIPSIFSKPFQNLWQVPVY